MFYHEGGQTLEQVAQRAYGTSGLEGRQNLTGQGPEQPVLSGSALSRVGPVGLQRPKTLFSLGGALSLLLMESVGSGRGVMQWWCV